MTASARFVIAGGGVVAAAAAYQLARRGAAVIIVEGDQPGVATNAGAGIICPWTAPQDDAWYRPAGCPGTPPWNGPGTG